MNADIRLYNNSQPVADKAICELLKKEIDAILPEAESKVWHGHPVWFLDENPIVGYHKLKVGTQLLFWSGQSFKEEDLSPEGTFKAAEIRYTSSDQVKVADLHRWLKKAKEIQWDYKNLIKRRGVLERLK